jgi:urease accessory protein UreH
MAPSEIIHPTRKTFQISNLYLQKCTVVCACMLNVSGGIKGASRIDTMACESERIRKADMLISSPGAEKLSRSRITFAAIKSAAH